MRFAVAVLLTAIAAAAGWTGGPPELTRVQNQGNASLWVPKRDGDSLKVKLAEVLTVVMRVEGEAPLQVDLTQRPRSTESWHLEMVGSPQTTAVPGTKLVRWEQVFKATPLEPGSHALQMPGLQVAEKEGAPYEVKWAHLGLTIVTRVGKVDISEARDLAPIEELPAVEVPLRPWWPWLFAALPVLGGLAFLVLRRRPRPAPEPSAREVILRHLAQLAALPVATAQDVERLHSRLSDVLRKYLEQRFELPATRRTTAEFVEALAKAAPLPEAQQELLNGILLRCDLAKFAGLTPAAEECRRTVMQVSDFVEQTASENTSVAKPGPALTDSRED
jgi:hypothetical protein